MQIYFKDVRKHSILSAKEERELLVKALSGDRKSKEKLINSNLRLVISIASKYIGMGVERDELVQEGNLGLVMALDHYDLSHTTRFTSHASFWIKNNIIASILQKNSTVRLPKNVIHDRSKNDESIVIMKSIEETSSSDNDTTYGDTLSSEDEFKKSDNHEYNQWLIDKCISRLTEREKNIITDYFGIGKDYEMCIDALAEKYELSGVRIRTLISQSLVKMNRAGQLAKASSNK